MRIALCLIAFFGVFGLIGTFDMHEEERQLEEYCENVYKGRWPDYNKVFTTDCKNYFEKALTRSKLPV